MPYKNSIRIDKITVHPDGRLEMLVREGNFPLDPNPSNDGVIFASRNDFVNQLNDWIDSLGVVEKIYLLMAPAVRSDPSLRLTTLENYRSKVRTFDFSTPGA